MRQNIKESLDFYVSERRPTGGFLRAVLENNLAETFGRADLENRPDVYEIVKYVYNYLPSCCWGSPKAVKNWLAKKD